MTAAIHDRAPRPSTFWRRHWKTSKLSWWGWATLSVLLIATVAGAPYARGAALVLATAIAAIYLARSRDMADFPTQLRVAYLGWMIASFVPVLVPFLWIQTFGTTALVFVGYCPLARLLLVLPQNRRRPLSAKYILKLIFHPPVEGSIRDVLGA
ncbi:hypothetical protein [Tropicimonas sp. IMCC6043]|uniref:hypothetical protein n=1 Tax=Tropicimonas sp. IMCC6043 TaxID=2510645 RepID=UPI00101CB487|nr:hypothetical protein [Tropicimonas sp. IMCC6043]RYH05669.1 hypothetical protein EU800_26035 [Tropicimonas sp. IMCC6043]